VKPWYNQRQTKTTSVRNKQAERRCVSVIWCSKKYFVLCLFIASVCLSNMKRLHTTWYKTTGHSLQQCLSKHISRNTCVPPTPGILIRHLMRWSETIWMFFKRMRIFKNFLIHSHQTVFNHVLMLFTNRIFSPTLKYHLRRLVAEHSDKCCCVVWPGFSFSSASTLRINQRPACVVLCLRYLMFFHQLLRHQRCGSARYVKKKLTKCEVYAARAHGRWPSWKTTHP